MLSRRWLYVALLIGAMLGLTFVQTHWLKGRYSNPRQTPLHSSQARGGEAWRNGHPSHWRACLLEHGTGLLSRTESFRIP